LDEIAAFEDDDEAAVDVLFQRALYGDHPLGRRTIGEARTIEAVGKSELGAWHERWYRPQNLVVASAGDVDHHGFASRVEELLTSRHDLDAPAGPPPPPERPAPAQGVEEPDRRRVP